MHIKTLLLFAGLAIFVAFATPASAQVTGSGVAIISDLYLGLKNQAVAALQEKLQTLGYFPQQTQPSGYFGVITKKAVQDFQKANGVPGTGYVGPLTRQALRAVKSPRILAETELKYKIIAELGLHFSCGNPVERIATEEEQKKQTEDDFSVAKNSQDFSVILQHLHLDNVTDFSYAQKALIVADYYHLQPVKLAPSTRSKYAFSFTYQDMVARAKGVEAIYASEGFIDQTGVITLTKKEQVRPQCPICLAGNTLIDTPHGSIMVSSLRPGTAVWTADKNGNRRESTVDKISHTPVPSEHQMVHLVLDDGRELFASPGHPTADGRIMASLSTGDIIDGVRIRSVQRTPYHESFTYDILPAGETGFYWANNILVGSTLLSETRSEK